MPAPIWPAPTTPMTADSLIVAESGDAPHGHGDAIAAAETERRDALVGAAVRHRVQERRENPRARGADRVAERHGAATDVVAVRADAELAPQRDLLNGERFVELVELHVVALPAGLRPDLLHGFLGRHHDPLRREARRRGGDDLGHWLAAELVGDLAARDDERGRAIVDARSVAGGDGATLHERR